jgi:hypothetical protein
LSHFVLECDHQALKPLFQKQLKGAIYERWLAILQQFDLDIEYKPTAQMCVPGALSRNPNLLVKSFFNKSKLVFGIPREFHSFPCKTR